MMKLLPTAKESSALRGYLPPLGTPQPQIEDSIEMLNECEQYMAVMLEVPDAKGKFECMIFRAELENNAERILEGATIIKEAIKIMKDSNRFSRLLFIVLKLGNALNAGGTNEEASAITLDSLLKLAEASCVESITHGFT